MWKLQKDKKELQKVLSIPRQESFLTSHEDILELKINSGIIFLGYLFSAIFICFNFQMLLYTLLKYILRIALL